MQELQVETKVYDEQPAPNKTLGTRRLAGHDGTGIAQYAGCDDGTISNSRTSLWDAESLDGIDAFSDEAAQECPNGDEPTCPCLQSPANDQYHGGRTANGSDKGLRPLFRPVLLLLQDQTDRCTRKRRKLIVWEVSVSHRWHHDSGVLTASDSAIFTVYIAEAGFHTASPICRHRGILAGRR